MRDDLHRPAAITFQGVGMRAGRTTVLSGVSISIDSGPPTIVIGPNGSGKTTLLKLAMGLIQAAEGTIMAAPDIRRGFVFQRPVLLRRSAADNIAFARTSAGFPIDAAAVLRLLDRVGLGHVASRPARKLSGGEQQRVALARALACEPDILFLDEPTASLDPAATKIIEDVLASVAAGGVKIVMATHDLGQARRLAGDIIFLANGRVAERALGPTFFSTPETDAARRFLAGDLVL